MKVLVIAASPRRAGTAASMADAAADAARAAGHAVERVDLYGLRLLPCTGCMACRAGGACVLRDDLPRVREPLLACGAVVLAAPTYFANVPGPVKNLFDRLAGAVMDEGPSGVPRGRLSRQNRYLLLTACTTPAPFDRLCRQSTGALRAMDEFFRASGLKRMGAVVCAGTKGHSGVPDRILKRIRRYWR